MQLFLILPVKNPLLNLPKIALVLIVHLSFELIFQVISLVLDLLDIPLAAANYPLDLWFEPSESYFSNLF